MSEYDDDSDRYAEQIRKQEELECRRDEEREEEWPTNERLEHFKRGGRD